MLIDRLIYNVALQVAVLLIGIYGYRCLPFFGKMLWLQVLISLTNYLLANYIWTDWNIALYNLYSMIEASLLLYAAYCFFGKTKKTLFLSLGGVVLMLFFLQVVTVSIKEFANYAYAIYSLIIAAMYLYIFYQTITTNGNRADAKAVRLISFGIVLFFACNTPYMGMMNYLNRAYPSLSTDLFHFITLVLSNIRYLLLAIGLLLMIRVRLIQKSVAHG